MTTPAVVGIGQNSRGVYFHLSTGKGSAPATVKRTRSTRVGRDGYTYWCASCGTNDACAHTRASSDHYAAHGATLPVREAAAT